MSPNTNNSQLNQRPFFQKSPTAKKTPIFSTCDIPRVTHLISNRKETAGRERRGVDKIS